MAVRVRIPPGTRVWLAGEYREPGEILSVTAEDLAPARLADWRARGLEVVPEAQAPAPAPAPAPEPAPTGDEFEGLTRRALWRLVKAAGLSEGLAYRDATTHGLRELLRGAQ